MKVTVTTLSDDIFVLDVSEDLELENFKAFCEVESGFPASELMVVFEGRPLIDDKKNLKSHGIKDGDVVILQHMLNSNQSLAVPGAPNGKFTKNRTTHLTTLTVNRHFKCQKVNQIILQPVSSKSVEGKLQPDK